MLGKKVWVYTSPHLVSIRERFVTEEWLISEENFIELLNKIESLPFKFSYFEKTTLISFLYFERKWCDYAIIETWFWGLLDSTNVVNPTLTAITSIWFDHKDFLWNTLEEISYQKAGIIKPCIPIIYNHENYVIKKVALEKNSSIIFTNKKVKTNLLGKFQELNAWIAYEVCKYLWVSEKAILSWLTSVEHHWRLEYIDKNLLIDGSHNEDSIGELKNYLDSLKITPENTYLCFSLKQWKNVSLVTNIFGKDRNYILIEKKHELVENSLVLKKQMKEVNISCETLKVDELRGKIIKQKNDLFVVFGSLYMIGEFYK